MKTIQSIILLGVVTASWSLPVQSANEQHKWRPYVCKMVEWTTCMKGKKRIYPTNDTFHSKDACLSGFEKKFEEDPKITEKYPQTEEMETSYAFYCEDMASPVDKAQLKSMEERSETIKKLSENYEKPKGM